MTTATQRRFVALAFTRTSQYAPQAIAAPGLVAAIPAEHTGHRPDI
jgi:hypothetical protein